MVEIFSILNQPIMLSSEIEAIAMGRLFRKMYTEKIFKIKGQRKKRI